MKKLSTFISNLENYLYECRFKRDYWIAFWMWMIMAFLISLFVASVINLSLLKMILFYIIIQICFIIIFIIIILFFGPLWIIQYIIHFSWNFNTETFKNLDLVEDSYAQAQKAIFSLFTRSIGIFIILGFLPRAIWAYKHGLSFAPMNITEDLSFSAYFWSPTIVGIIISSIIYLNYIHYLSIHIVRPEDLDQEEKNKIMELRNIVMEVARMKYPIKYEQILSILNRFLDNQPLWVLCIILIILSVIIYSMIFYLYNSDNINIINIYIYSIIIAQVAITLSQYIVIILAGIYIPKIRFIGLITMLILGMFPLLFIINDMISAIDQHPQQYGGFRPEHYIAKWKGEDKEKRISVVYKTDKFLFCQPEDAQKNPNWKCTILSTEGLERLVPDTQMQASK